MTVAEVVGDEYKQWNCGEKIVFDMQTGHGKTSFILETLLPYVHGRNERILFLANRSALEKQVNLRVPPEYQTAIQVMTYQKFAVMRYMQYEGGEQVPNPEWENIRQMKYWIMDEAHYFLSDVAFSGKMNKCLERLLQEEYKKIMIFMTATPKLLYLAMYNKITNVPPRSLWVRSLPENPGPPSLVQISSFYHNHPSPMLTLKALLENKERVDMAVKEIKYIEGLSEIEKMKLLLMYDYSVDLRLEQLKSAQEDYYKEKFNKYKKMFSEMKKTCRLYHSLRDYSYLAPQYYMGEEEIAKIVKKTGTEKWIIFVRRKEQGNLYRELLVKQGLIDTVFITADSKKASKKSVERMNWESIINENRFLAQVLITTKVLDNGVNIDDELVKHIVIEETEETEFLQMLGRKRVLNSSEKKAKVNVYLNTKTIGEIRKQFSNNIMPIIKFLHIFERTRESTGHSGEDVIYLTRPPNMSRLKPYMENGQFKKPYSSYLVEAKNGNHPFDEKATKDNPLVRVDLFEKNNLAVRKLTYDYYKFLSWIEQSEKAGGTQFPWLEEQLSWIGKEYDETQWINYEEQLMYRTNLECLLKENCGNLAPLEEKEMLREAVRNYAEACRPKHKIVKSAYSVKLINSALCDWNLPYSVVSKSRSHKGKKANYWHIEENDEIE